jgi:hypothetical protein
MTPSAITPDGRKALDSFSISNRPISRLKEPLAPAAGGKDFVP